MIKAAVSPDLILVNGDLRTQDPSNPTAEALAVGAGRILAVGDNVTISELATPDTERLDLGGRLGLPGFVDIHSSFAPRASNSYPII